MTRQGRLRLAAVLGAGCLVAAGFAAASLVRPSQREAPAARLATDPQLELANLALPPLHAFPQTTERPLFSTTRSPARAAAPPAGEEGLILGRYRLVGTVVTPSRSFVVLRPAAGGAVLRREEGEALDGWRIEKISADALTLSEGARTETVPLRKAPK